MSVRRSSRAHRLPSDWGLSTDHLERARSDGLRWSAAGGAQALCEHTNFLTSGSASPGVGGAVTLRDGQAGTVATGRGSGQHTRVRRRLLTDRAVA